MVGKDDGRQRNGGDGGRQQSRAQEKDKDRDQDKGKHEDKDDGSGGQSKLATLAKVVYDNLNWFRIHLIAYTFLPILFAGFFVAANPSPTSGQWVTTYLDAVFMCFSAMTVCGLNVLSVSTLQPAQQAFLFILMLIGDISVVNLITVLCRLVWFERNCKRITKSNILQRLHSRAASGESAAENGNGQGGEEPGIRIRQKEGKQVGQPGGGPETSGGNRRSSGKDHDQQRERKGENQAQPGAGEKKGYEMEDGNTTRPAETPDGEDDAGNGSGEGKREEREDGPHRDSSSSTATAASRQPHYDEGEEQPLLSYHPHKVGFHRRHHLRKRAGHKKEDRQGARSHEDRIGDPHSFVPHASSGRSAHSGRGGFPGIHLLVFSLVNKFLPGLSHRMLSLLQMTEEEEEQMHSSHQGIMDTIKEPFVKHMDQEEGKKARRVKWLPPGVRGVVVGRNSQFFEEELGDEDLELLGVLEYRATRILVVLVIMLLWIVLPFALVSIYFAKVPYWDSNFIANGSTQSGTVDETWFTMFQSVSAYSSCGLSLVDTLMIPFQFTYLLIYVLLFPMLAGNQLLPVFLRAEVWMLSKVVKHGSELEVELHFILTHSRRFFLYLFPTYQTWWLFGIEFSLVVIGVLGFVAFNHGLPAYNTLGTTSGWDKFTIGLFQGISSRASGFSIVYLSQIAPALNFLYMILAFTSNYPLVMAIRSTNVYEERALGMHGEHPPNPKKPHDQSQGDEKDQGKSPDQQSGGIIFSKYLKDHLLPQIYFDLWPIFIGVMFICVMERHKILDSDDFGWLNLFQILFEGVSGYATVGLSYGNPYNTSSLSFTFRKISKIIMIALMLRGRHRGLPLAIDRAIMFPIEYCRLSSEEEEKVAEDRVGQAGEEAQQE